jgi:hypothetical protein
MSDQMPLDFSAARRERDAGMTRAADHAEREHEGWQALAYAHIVTYARTHAQFVSEECTSAATIPAPPDTRAWGHPFRMAAKDGVIVRDGYGISARRHLSPTPLWRSTIAEAAA